MSVTLILTLLKSCLINYIFPKKISDLSNKKVLFVRALPTSAEIIGYLKKEVFIAFPFFLDLLYSSLFFYHLVCVLNMWSAHLSFTFDY